MQISHTSELANGRGHYAIGRIRAAAEWRAASASGARADRLTAMRELIREAEEYGADAIVGLEFHIDDVKRAEIEGAALLRILTASGALEGSRSEFHPAATSAESPRSRRRCEA